MEIGISSSCFYPMLIEESLKAVGECGAKTAEIFVNSECELKGDILDELCHIREYYGIDVRSMHPFTSAYETVMLFSEYERRTRDSIEFYKRYFYAANCLAAKIVVLHGGKSVIPIPAEKYAERYAKLLDVALSEGIYIAHENVKEHHCSDPKFMKAVADLIGEKFRMVLDIKQCRRSGQSEYEFIDLLGKNIAQLHLSDCNAEKDCLAPGAGDYDFKKLFEALKNIGYNKSGLIELYRGNYENSKSLMEAKAYLEKI